MVKTKRKLEMTLPELIEWGFKNKVKNREFVTNQANFPVAFNSCGYAEFSDEYSYSPEDTFTVEIEEEFTEETEIDNLVEFYFDRYGDLRFANHKNKTIRQRLDKYSFKPQAFYSLNEDATMTLIWKDGKLVD
ncbi:hypothetical protein L4I60_03110 [Staphylococcus epidermidis]|uniref:hypothetical protein n=1 Tax=Staphylococcus epidermidis TaxID=1282 RepID=UPI001F35F346|nr:hypothetical protein [Staphylococcus epidermidis]MCF7581249.1 hypothetical protein [Staphylococcus epidermidis]